jgi:hypothetical protein
MHALTGAAGAVAGHQRAAAGGAGLADGAARRHRQGERGQPEAQFPFLRLTWWARVV